MVSFLLHKVNLDDLNKNFRYIKGTSQQRRHALPESTQNTTGTTTRIVGFSSNSDNQRNFEREGLKRNHNTF